DLGGIAGARQGDRNGDRGGGREVGVRRLAAQLLEEDVDRRRAGVEHDQVVQPVAIDVAEGRLARRWGEDHGLVEGQLPAGDVDGYDVCRLDDINQIEAAVFVYVIGESSGRGWGRRAINLNVALPAF